MEVQTNTQVSNENLDAITNAVPVEQPAEVESNSDSFEDYMLRSLGGDSKIEANEEELFSSLIEQRLEHESPEAAEYYREERGKLTTSMSRADGYVPVEDIAVAALKSCVSAGKIDSALAEQINGEAFAAAQLDDNKNALYDSRGSGEDPTVAVANMEAALLSMKTAIEQIESGELQIAPRPLDTPSNGTPSGPDSSGGVADPGSAPDGTQEMDGSGGFLWKPVSESDGNLVVLLPTSLKGLIDRVEIHSSLPPDETTFIEKGRFAGDEHNGGRPHFRFDNPGSEYGSDVHLVVYKDTGETVSWNIGDGGDRHD